MTNANSTATDRPLRVGTRGSELALAQARRFCAALGRPCEEVIIKTAGDRIQHLSLDKVEGKGFFTKEIEAALLEKRVDFAVHSYKDLTIEQPPGLMIAAVPKRESAADALVIAPSAWSAAARWSLKEGARVGTSSLRRQAQLRYRRSDLVVEPLRGNVTTRVQKVREGSLDAVVLAAAGLARLNLAVELEREGLRVLLLSPDEILPAPAQGALAIQIRIDDPATEQAIEPQHHPETEACTALERQLLARFGGGCHLPLGALAEPESDGFRLQASVTAPDGSAECRVEVRGRGPEDIVARAHAQLVQAGAEAYITA